MFSVNPNTCGIKIETLDGVTFAKRFKEDIKNFTYLGRWQGPEQTYICASIEGNLAGFARLEETKNDTYISYLEVAKEYQKQKISRGILCCVFEYAAKDQKTIILSPFTEMGWERLNMRIMILQKEYPDTRLIYE